MTTENKARKVRVAFIEVVADEDFLTEDDATEHEGWDYLEVQLKRFMQGFGRAASYPAVRVEAYFESWADEAETL